MTFTASNFLLVGAILMLLSIIFTKWGSKLGVPTLLLFLVAGMLFGTDGLGIEFSSMKEAQFIGMVALCVILFTGGMETAFSEIKSVARQGITLSTVGVLLTTIFTGVFIFGMSRAVTNVTVTLAFCLLLAATMSSTDSASVFNILRSQNINLRHHARPMLELESGSNDPMAYMLTIALIQVCNEPGSFSVWMIIFRLLIQLVVGALMGWLMGRLTVKFINKINLTNASLYPIILLCVIFITFSLTEFVKGNGYLAVYLAGMIVGNKPLVKKRECTKFLDGMTWLLQIAMFLALGLLVNPHEMFAPRMIIFATTIAVFIIFIGRPLAVILSMLPFCKLPHFNPSTITFVSWVGLRGATPIIFATYPVVADVPGSDYIFNIVFFITILSLILQGTTIPFMARKLNMVRDAPEEGNQFGIELPEEMDHKLWEMEVNEAMLEKGNQLKTMSIPEGNLVIMIKRGSKYLIPNGTMEIKLNDFLLFLSYTDQDKELVLQK